MTSKNGFLKKALQGSKNDYCFWKYWALRQIYFIIIYSEQMKQLIIKKLENGFLQPPYI